MEQVMKNVDALNQDMKDAGVWVFGSPLAHPATSTVVRVADGEVLLTDGPFAEGKEHIGGFTIIEVPDLDAALKWAGKAAAAITLPIEVRPFEGVH
nr:YciI family protein [Lentzea tibetensis]